MQKITERRGNEHAEAHDEQDTQAHRQETCIACLARLDLCRWLAEDHAIEEGEKADENERDERQHDNGREHVALAKARAENAELADKDAERR